MSSEALKPEVWRDGLTGACLGFEGGLLNINRDGSGNLAFAENDLEWEQDDESGKEYRYVNIPKSEFDAIRDFLDHWFPRSATDPKVQALVAALEWYRDQECEGFCEGFTPRICASTLSDDCGGCRAATVLAAFKDTQP